MVVVEFYGLARHRARIAELVVEATTVREALQAVAERCPELVGLLADGGVPREILISVNGEHFVTDLEMVLVPQDRLLLLSADAGG